MIYIFNDDDLQRIHLRSEIEKMESQPREKCNFAGLVYLKMLYNERWDGNGQKIKIEKKDA